MCASSGPLLLLVPWRLKENWKEGRQGSEWRQGGWGRAPNAECWRLQKCEEVVHDQNKSLRLEERVARHSPVRVQAKDPTVLVKMRWLMKKELWEMN